MSQLTHLSWHPGPDPSKKPFDWGPLCGATLATTEVAYDPLLGEFNRGFAINPDPIKVDCPDCVVIYWSGRHEGFLSPKTPKAAS
jgi:hypothetical protein